MTSATTDAPSSHPLPAPTGKSASDELSPNGVAHRFLTNGLEVVVIPDHRAPVATHMIWYKNGSADDPAGKSGIAHFLEHLMFKGTRKHPAGQFSTLVAELGGQQNAFTSHDVTAYFQQIPREHLAACMAFEADRMKNVILTDEIVAPERSVVLEERAMRTENTPAEILGEAVQAALFTTHPYGKPVIGWREEIEGLDRADALAYYERFYTPENALLVVAGDVEPAAAIELASRIYGPIARRDTPPRRQRPREPKPTTHRQVTLADAKVAQPQFQRLHLVPSYGNAAPGEAEALDLLAFLLGRNQTGILYRKLVKEDGIASGVGAGYVGGARDDTRFALAATPKPGICLDRLDAAIESIIGNCLQLGFEAADIDRAKRRLVAGAVYARDNQMAQSRHYGMSLCIGLTIEQIRSWPERIAAVTPEEVMGALRRLDRSRCVSGFLLRSGSAAAASAAA
jgi:zinc protease